MNALDVENCSSSWNSEGNSKTEAALTLHFGRRVIPLSVKFQFQAGFAAEACEVYDAEATTLIDELELDDVHELQTRTLDTQNVYQSVSTMKFVFDDFCDLYGRMIIYRLEVWGHACQDAE